MRGRKPKFQWKQKRMCSDCPFQEQGAGLHLRHSLKSERWEGILQGVRLGQRFSCHQTTKETGDGTDLYCAGALALQEKEGIASPYVQLCQSFEHIDETKEELFRRLRLTFRQEVPMPEFKLPANLLLETIMQVVEDDEQRGFCLTCGADVEGVEPDARQYECTNCGELTVFGAEEILLMVGDI